MTTPMTIPMFITLIVHILIVFLALCASIKLAIVVSYKHKVQPMDVILIAFLWAMHICGKW